MKIKKLLFITIQNKAIGRKFIIKLNKVLMKEISEKIKNLKILEGNEQDLKNMVLHAPIGICILDAPSLIAEIVNESFIEVAGKPYEAIIGKYYWDAFSEARPYYESALHQVVDEGITYHANEVKLMLIRHGREEIVYVSFVYAPLKDEEGKVKKVAIWVLDNTPQVVARQRIEESENKYRDLSNSLEIQVQERTRELKELNESLVKSEQRYHQMVEEVQDYAILYINRDGVVENWNKGAEKIKGYLSSEIIGQNFSVFYTEEDRKNNLPKQLLDRATQNGRAVQEGWRVRKDGTLFWASVVITAVHNKLNEVIGFSKVTHDLTQKKKASDNLKASAMELEQKNTDLAKMNKELQSFAYISSHDLQEPLRKIQTFSTMIMDKEYQNLSDDGKDRFQRMQNAAKRMRALIEDLLTYSRASSNEKKFRNTDLNKILEEVKEDLKEELEQKHAQIETTTLCRVNIIPFQFRQMIYNLISNSLKFSNSSRSPYIKIRSEIASGAKLNNEKLLGDTVYCHITISDNGIGFEQQYNEKIFEVFQRLHTQEKYKGTGVGLAIVKKIVENHQGTITAKGEVDKGASFDIYFPVTEIK